MRFLKSALALAVLCAWAACAAQSDRGSEIEVQLLNEWTGKPLPPQTVIVSEAIGEIGSPAHAQDFVKELRAQTGRDGSARYKLSMPLPDRLFLYLSPLRACSVKGLTAKSNQYRPEEVIKSGIVIPADCVPKRWHGKFHWQDVPAQPGVVIVFASPPPRAQW